jgi:hypothetical protein
MAERAEGAAPIRRRVGFSQLTADAVDIRTGLLDRRPGPETADDSFQPAAVAIGERPGVQTSEAFGDLERHPAVDREVKIMLETARGATR